jgi:hypothetical protein
MIALLGRRVESAPGLMLRAPMPELGHLLPVKHLGGKGRYRRQSCRSGAESASCEPDGRNPLVNGRSKRWP